MLKFDSLGFLPNEKFDINNFSLLRDNLFFRNIKYNNIEILKLISFLVRDKNWNNYTPEIIKTTSYNKDNYLHFEFDLKYGDIEQLEVKILLSIGISFLNLALIFNLPTEERSYLSELKNKFLKSSSAVSIVGGSPGLSILNTSNKASSLDLALSNCRVFLI